MEYILVQGACFLGDVIITLWEDVYQSQCAQFCTLAAIGYRIFGKFDPNSVHALLVNLNMVVPLSAFTFLAAGTPYEGGVFRMKLVLGRDFPAAPPQGKESSTRQIKLSVILGHD